MELQQAINVMESVLNATLKAGLFQNIADFQVAVDALNVIKGSSLGSVVKPNYVSTDTSQIKE